MGFRLLHSLSRTNVGEFNLQAAINKFKMSLFGFSEHTQVCYKSILSKLVAFMPDDIRKIQPEHLESYLLSLKGHNPNTINFHLAVLKSFFGWLSDNYDIKDVSHRIKRLRPLPPYQRILSDEEFNKLSVNCSDKIYLPLFLIANTGLRAAELVAVRPEHFDGKFLTVPKGKGLKMRRIPCNKFAISILVHPINFPKSVKQLQRLCIKAAMQAKIDHFSPHSLRHYFADSLRRRGNVPITTIAKLLGHSSVSTTFMIYQHWLDSDLSGVTDCLI